MNAIVAISKNWGIGCDGKLLFNIPEDMKQFKEKTKGKVVVMGRKTLESLPNGQPLFERVNIVLTKDVSYTNGRAIVVNSIDELMETLTEYNTKDIFIIGGSSIYKQMLPHCDTVYLTIVDKVDMKADAFFPRLSISEWFCETVSKKKHYKDLSYKFLKCRRRTNKLKQTAISI